MAIQWECIYITHTNITNGTERTERMDCILHTHIQIRRACSAHMQHTESRREINEWTVVMNACMRQGWSTAVWWCRPRCNQTALVQWMVNANVFQELIEMKSTGHVRSACLGAYIQHTAHTYVVVVFLVALDPTRYTSTQPVGV